MKKDIKKIIEIPEGIEISMDGREIVVKSNGREIKRMVGFRNVDVKISDGKAVISSKKGTKREAKIAGTTEAHLRNMINGLKEDFVYKLEIANVHFPMNVKVEGNSVSIKNFFGEKVARIAKILPNVKVEVKGNEITVSSFNREAAGQTAANIEKATRVTGRDRRVFQDGIYMTAKPGRVI